MTLPAIYNFSAGPAALPHEVLAQVQAELLNWQGLGVSVMEISHRSPEYLALIAQIEQDFRELLAIPTHYKVLFLPGGATIQFAMVPLNLLRGQPSADYVNTGIWSSKAIAEAKRYGQVNVVASSEPANFTDIPEQATWRLDAKAAYLHYTDNETIGGVEFPEVPKSDGVPLVSDMSSNILTRPLPIDKFGLIYAATQKNLGPAGITVVIVREDLLDQPHAHTPAVFNYQLQSQQSSLYNTPPTFSWYVLGLVLQWVKRQGGVTAMAASSQRKANALYAYIDSTDFYHNTVAKPYRSRINVPFKLPSAQLDGLFLQEAQQQGLLNLKGHRLAGGVRASIYNAMPEAGVAALITFMQTFVKRHG